MSQAFIAPIPSSATRSRPLLHTLHSSFRPSSQTPRRTRVHANPSLKSPRMTITADKAQRDFTLYVDAQSRRYPILFSELGLSKPETFQPYIKGDKVLIVTNETIAPLYLQRVKNAIQSTGVTVFEIILPDGEQYKNLSNASLIWDMCMEKRLDRKSTIVALGGGVIGDTAGFTAATFVRGLPFIQIPTTLLAVVDSSVGGKTAINHHLGKNMIGAFYQPQAVIVDTQVLKTLDDRQLAAGISEIIKYGIIRDWPFFEWCEQNIHSLSSRDPEALHYAMVQSCKYKAQIVSEDENERGVRAILNLGHTFGHAIEASMGYGQWLHGEAVAVGMVMACNMSARLGFISADITKRVEAVLTKASLPTRPPPSVTLERFMTYMSVDKKVESGVLRLILLKEPGKAVITSDFPESVLFDTIMHYHRLYKESPGTYEHSNFGLPE